jgi:hypothetical protein
MAAGPGCGGGLAAGRYRVVEAAAAGCFLVVS